MGKDVIVALDFDSAERTMEFLDLFQEEKPFVKIGLELFYSQGPDIVRRIKARGHKVFLDVKLHDIPNQVKKAMTVLGGLSLDIVNVHAAGTIAMMKAAKEGFEEGLMNAATQGDETGCLSKGESFLIAVTQLTSTDQETMERDILIEKPIDQVVESYALNAKAAGLSGVVCSAQEAEKIHRICGDDFVTVTPGIRFADSEVGDQKRVMTPAEAKKVGSDYIVVGRPITQAADPVEAYSRCVQDFLGE